MRGVLTSPVTGPPVMRHRFPASRLPDRLAPCGFAVRRASGQPTAIEKMPIAPWLTVAGRVMLATVFELSTGMVCEKT